MPRGKAKKATRGATAGAKINKSEFVRSLPASMSAKDVIEKAKEAGIGVLSPAYVYSIRTASKARARAKAARGVGGRLPVRAAAAGGSRAEDLLRAVAAEIGLSRAIALLEAEQQKVRAVLGR